MSRQWIWVKTGIPPKCKLTRWQKQPLVAEAEEFLRTFYRQQFLPPPSANRKFNYVTDFSVCWHGSYLRFTARYACPSPDAFAPFFDHHFARLGYFDSDRYNLWTRRHNNEWIVIAEDLTLHECFAEMRDNPWFHF
ncbi:MAG: hypothetical protein Q7S40_00275 [Opitutaceae bacterium]|nr:hypothetical protein [Opitutaceae bacterium]